MGAKAVSYHNRSSAESQIFDSAFFTARKCQLLFFSVFRLSLSRALINPCLHAVTGLHLFKLTQFCYLNFWCCHSWVYSHCSNMTVALKLNSAPERWNAGICSFQRLVSTFWNDSLYNLPFCCLTFTGHLFWFMQKMHFVCFLNMHELPIIWRKKKLEEESHKQVIMALQWQHSRDLLNLGQMSKASIISIPHIYWSYIHLMFFFFFAFLSLNLTEILVYYSFLLFEL